MVLVKGEVGRHVSLNQCQAFL